MALPTVYNPQNVEEKWYQYWLDKHYFHAEVEPDKEPFCIVIPPPNVTGVLHLGHALDNTLQDILIRWRRMQGYNTLWMPGTDHAGIATQAKVEESIAAEGLSKYDLGREQFLERTWEWKRKYGGTIIKQLKRLGASCDWDRERFTMDEGCSVAVREVFLRLYEKGLIYRGSYLINWCPKCRTTISDIEVEHEEREGNLWHIRYPYADGSGYIEVATTRPETMLGDTGVAVNPNDERYQDIIGKEVILPIVNRRIPVFADEYVDMSFGTGAVKVTPAHDPNDLEMGMRHQLPQITVIGFDAKMTAEAGKFAGMDRYECRKALVAELEKEGFLVKVEPHSHAVGQCYRCDTVIEPLISKQWFVKMKPLAEPAIQAAQSGQIRFVPERFTKIYLGWLENIRDWCISRQLWWGHRIPVWYCQDCNEVIPARAEPATCPKCNSTNLEQDPDVLDTWFSSALWPFSTMGWPNETQELKQFYPTSVLVTGRDIIFFWVARMVFMGLEFMKQEPFKDIMIHGLVLDKNGDKMSKSRPETMVDPQEVIDNFGADTLRFTLVTGTALGQDQRFQMEKVEGSRNFTNKIWNAARFVMLQSEKELAEDLPAEELAVLTAFAKGESDQIPSEWLSLPDQWILTRIQQVIAETTSLLEKYDLSSVASLLYEFFWNEYCDWFIELSKHRLNKGTALEKKTSQAVLNRVLRQIMELLHPIIPFITEEIWQNLPHQGDSIMITKWPESQPTLKFDAALATMEMIIEVIKAIRNIRSEANVQPQKKVAVTFMTTKEKEQQLAENINFIINMSGLETVEFISEGTPAPEKAISAVIAGITIFLPTSGLVDVAKEKERLSKELNQLENEIAKIKSRIENPAFSAKAPAEVVEKERVKIETFKEKAAKIRERLEQL
ncbi:MAG TPA: valine--tRNA ligase [Bacillota bacterium]|nr:valine--tRNA ligase [Bacillota bacterium]HOL09200.1 valine--tRNA ligase [Bacillota bacterium]HPO97024.1 valine--tRNA ligase [Bacillota bacterium]